MSVHSWTDTCADCTRLVVCLVCFIFVRKYDCIWGVNVFTRE